MMGNKTGWQIDGANGLIIIINHHQQRQTNKVNINIVTTFVIYLKNINKSGKKYI
jgi:hypothetical protein